MTNMEEFFEERAAILQFCAGYPKEKAEKLANAELETYKQMSSMRSKEETVTSSKQPFA